MERLHRKLERALYVRGFTHPQTRGLMQTQLYACALLCALGLASGPLGGFVAWSLPMVLGALLATWNFHHICRFAGAVFLEPFSRGLVARLLILFYGRLFVTGAVIFVLLRYCGASSFALLAGLSSVVAAAIAWSALHLTGYTMKEA